MKNLNVKKNRVPLTQTEERLIHALANKKVKVEIKHPIVFGLMSTFGFVSILYGFEKLIDKIDLFVNKPWILFVFGLGILVVTGSAYKKLN